jgi:hypothetical protein
MPELQKHPDGTVVHKWFRGYGWFQGEILSFNGRYYRVRYVDGDEEDCSETEIDDFMVEAAFRPTKHPIGTEIQKFFPGHGWFRGYVSEFDGKYYKVYYEDGDEEEYEEKEVENLLHLASTRKPPKHPVGSEVKKRFGAYGFFQGKVVDFNGILYTVLYRDGDREQYDEAELAEILVKDPAGNDEPKKNLEPKSRKDKDGTNRSPRKLKRARTKK